MIHTWKSELEPSLQGEKESIMIRVERGVSLHNWNIPHPCWVPPVNVVNVATKFVSCLPDDQVKALLLEGPRHFVVRLLQGADVEVT